MYKSQFRKTDPYWLVLWPRVTYSNDFWRIMLYWRLDYWLLCHDWNTLHFSNCYYLFAFLFIDWLIYCNQINAALVSIRYNTNTQKVIIPNFWPVFTLHKWEHFAAMSVNKYDDDIYDGDDTLVSSSSFFLQFIMFFSSICHAEQVWSHGPVLYHREGHTASTSRPNPHHQHQRPQSTPHCGALTAQPTTHMCLWVHGLSVHGNRL